MKEFSKQLIFLVALFIAFVFGFLLDHILFSGKEVYVLKESIPVVYPGSDSGVLPAGTVIRRHGIGPGHGQLDFTVVLRIPDSKLSVIARALKEGEILEQTFIYGAQ